MDICEYCGAEYYPNRFHPGCCDECGAPREKEKQFHGVIIGIDENGNGVFQISGDGSVGFDDNITGSDLLKWLTKEAEISSY